MNKEISLLVDEGFERGVELGWWPSWDKDRREPHPWPWCWAIEAKELKREVWHREWEMALWTVVKKPTVDTKFMAQLLFLMGVFSSVGEARRAGWDKPIKPGEFWFKNRTVHLFVEES